MKRCYMQIDDLCGKRKVNYRKADHPLTEECHTFVRLFFATNGCEKIQGKVV